MLKQQQKLVNALIENEKRTENKINENKINELWRKSSAPLSPVHIIDHQTVEIRYSHDKCSWCDELF